MSGKIPVKPWSARLRLRFLNVAGEPYQSEVRLDWGPNDGNSETEAPEQSSVYLGSLSPDGTLDVVVNAKYTEGLLYFGTSLGPDYKTAAKLVMRVVLKRPTPLTDLPYRLSNLGYMAVDPDALVVLDADLSDATMRFQRANDLRPIGQCDGNAAEPTTRDRLIQVHDKDAARFFE